MTATSQVHWEFVAFTYDTGKSDVWTSDICTANTADQEHINLISSCSQKVR